MAGISLLNMPTEISQRDCLNVAALTGMHCRLQATKIIDKINMMDMTRALDPVHHVNPVSTRGTILAFLHRVSNGRMKTVLRVLPGRLEPFIGLGKWNGPCSVLVAIFLNMVVRFSTQPKATTRKNNPSHS